MGRTAFFLRAYNDVDHLAPVIWKFVTNGDNPIVVFHTDLEYENDCRINFIKSEGEVEIIRVLDREYVKYQKKKGGPVFKILQRYYNLKRNHRTIVGKIHRKRFFNCEDEINFLRDKNVTQCIFEWNTPYIRGVVIEKYFKAAKGQGITTLCLPHGCNMFTHSDVNEGYRSSIKKGIIPDQKDRREYDYYVFQNPFRRDGWVKWGYDPAKTFAWGSARWCPEWQKINLSICPNFEPKKNPDDRFRVVFMQYQGNYNLNKEKIWETLTRIAENKKIQLVIKDSTREYTQYHSAFFQNKYGTSSRIEFVGNEVHSPSLIEWSDCVINFGSSIGVEALIQNKPLINPTFFLSNRTFYERKDAAFNAGNVEEVLGYIDKIMKDEYYNIPSRNKEELFKEIIFGGREKFNVLESYYRKIKATYLSY